MRHSGEGRNPAHLELPICPRPITCRGRFIKSGMTGALHATGSQTSKTHPWRTVAQFQINSGRDSSLNIASNFFFVVYPVNPTITLEESIMNNGQHICDGFRFLPPSLAAWMQTFIPDEYDGVIPWTPLSKPVQETTFALVTSAGISLKSDPPFDMEREMQEPTWGDPTSRELPRGTTEAEITVNHLHINCTPILEDMNVILPVSRMAELESDGAIGRLAPTAYSFYGFQWESDAFIETGIAPMAETMTAEGVEAVLLTPA